MDGPGEQLTVDVLGQRVSGFHGLLSRRGLDQHLPSHRQPTVTQPVSHLWPLNSQQLGEDSQRAVVHLRGHKRFGLAFVDRRRGPVRQEPRDFSDIDGASVGTPPAGVDGDVA